MTEGEIRTPESELRQNTPVGPPPPCCPCSALSSPGAGMRGAERGITRHHPGVPRPAGGRPSAGSRRAGGRPGGAVPGTPLRSRSAVSPSVLGHRSLLPVRPSEEELRASRSRTLAVPTAGSPGERGEGGHAHTRRSVRSLLPSDTQPALCHPPAQNPRCVTLRHTTRVQGCRSARRPRPAPGLPRRRASRAPPPLPLPRRGSAASPLPPSFPPSLPPPAGPAPLRARATPALSRRLPPAPRVRHPRRRARLGPARPGAHLLCGASGAAARARRLPRSGARR